MSKDGVYPIPQLSNLSSSSINSAGFVDVSDHALLWHKRLGHPCSKILHSTLSDFQSVHVPVNSDICSQCPGCISAKMHKHYVPKHVLDSSFPLELVHVVPNWFYVIFVDDFTCFAWMFLLRHKFDVFNVFVHFKALVENQFDTTIKVLRSDRVVSMTIINSSLFVCLMEFSISFLVHIHLTRMVLLRGNIGI